MNQRNNPNPKLRFAAYFKSSNRFSSQTNSQGEKRTQAATGDSFYIGKHVGEDRDRDRLDETIGYIAIESGVWTINGIEIAVGLTGDNVTDRTQSLGVDGFDPSGAVVTQSGMDGRDGGFAVLRESNSGGLAIGIDEDTLRDSERRHTSEQVSFFMFRPATTTPSSVLTDDEEVEEVTTTQNDETVEVVDTTRNGGFAYMAFRYHQERTSFNSFTYLFNRF